MKKTVLLLPAAFVIGGVILLVIYANSARSAFRSAGWTQALGTIEKAAIGDVIYRYRFNGGEYRSSVVAHGNARTSAARYAVGKNVLVYVNPQKPQEAVLELGRPPSKLPMFAGLALLYVGVATLLVLWKRGAFKPKKKRVRKHAPPMSRLRPPPSIKRT